jgi:hypothetical protein
VKKKQKQKQKKGNENRKSMAGHVMVWVDRSQLQSKWVGEEKTRDKEKEKEKRKKKNFARDFVDHFFED